MEFRALPSWVKLLAWAVSVVALLAVFQAALWIVGWQTNVLESGTPLLVVSLLTLLALMSFDRRPLSDYGAIVGPSWRRLLAWGVGLGVLTYTAYVLLALALGAYQLRTDSLTAGRLANALATGLTALPLAATQQFVFSGYLLAMLRDRCSKLGAVLISAGLFAVLNRVEDLPSLVEPRTQQLLLGLFLTAALLGTLRLVTGSILVPTGLLTGWLFVRRFTHVLRVLKADVESPFHDWFLPGGDPRQAPVMALLLGLGLVASWLVLKRRGEGRVALSEQALDADFKRVFPFSHPNMLAPLDIWLGRLISARFRVGLDYVPRLLAILVLSTFNTLLTLPERLILPRLLRGRQIQDPVFIVGVHRSGTTHLHRLLALDPQFTAPAAFHALNPHGCVFSGWLLVPLLLPVLPWRRPMDNVPFHLFGAEEEEFGVAGTCRMSPYWGFAFPHQSAEYDRYIFPDQLPAQERAGWEYHYQEFLKKVAFWSRKRLLLKSPHNTGRVAALRRLYPRARFIHIRRHPHDVYRSNMHIAREAHVLFQLQDPDPAQSYAGRFLDNYRAMETAWRRDSQTLAENQRAEVRFEDLERDPLGVIQRLYQALGWELSANYRQRLERYLEGQKGYRKNRHQPLDEADRQRIELAMGEFLRSWGYEDSADQRPPAGQTDPHSEHPQPEHPQPEKPQPEVGERRAA